MPVFNHKDRLTVIFKVSFDETTAIERIRKYFSTANYQELDDERPVVKFQRFANTKEKMPKFLLKSFFLGGLIRLDTNNRYSLARIKVESKVDGVSIKVSFEEYDEWYECFFIREILKKEIESLRKATLENIFEQIVMHNMRRKYFISTLEQVLLYVFSLILIILLLVPLFSIFKNAVICLIVDGAIVFGLNLLFSYWHRKRIERKIVSSLN